MKCAQLEQQLTEMRAELLTSSVEIDHELNDDFTHFLDSVGIKVTPFMNLFWQEQKRLFARINTGVRYHPMIIERLSLTLPGLTSNGKRQR